VTGAGEEGLDAENFSLNLPTKRDTLRGIDHDGKGERDGIAHRAHAQ
jgi:hypothetical protein